MKRQTKLLILLLTILALLVPTTLTGAQTIQVQIRPATHAATTGGTGVSGSYVLHGTLGQGSVSLSQGITQTASGGIWRGASAAD